VVGYEPEVIALSDKPEGVFARGGDTTKQEQYGFRAHRTLEAEIGRTLEYVARCDAGADVSRHDVHPGATAVAA
jgi:hypothetical protein